MLLVSLPLAAAEVWQVTWPTQHASPPATVSGQTAAFMPAFRMALEKLPEGLIVTLALSQPAILGITPEHAKTLQPLITERYKSIAASETFREAPSALSYCFGETRPAHGLATVHVPSDFGPKSPVMVFLHGYGGSFIWYLHYLAEHFPQHLIICPAYGISPSAVPMSYLSECIAAVGKRLQKPIIVKPWLLGLSAGGFGACRLYQEKPMLFAGMICIAAYPLTQQNGRTNAHFIAGGEEPFVKSGHFQRLVGPAKSHLIPNADHFFLLTHRTPAVAKLREWIELHEGRN